MRRPASDGAEAADADDGCAFILDSDGIGCATIVFCRAPCVTGSSYCPRHHRVCHLPAGSLAERRQLRELDALAKAVGGRQGRAARQPPAPLLRQLDRIARAFARR